MYVVPNDSLGEDVCAGCIADITSLAAGRLGAYSPLSVQVTKRCLNIQLGLPSEPSRLHSCRTWEQCDGHLAPLVPRSGKLWGLGGDRHIPSLIHDRLPPWLGAGGHAHGQFSPTRPASLLQAIADFTAPGFQPPHCPLYALVPTQLPDRTPLAAVIAPWSEKTVSR